MYVCTRAGWNHDYRRRAQKQTRPSISPRPHLSGFWRFDDNVEILPSYSNSHDCSFSLTKEILCLLAERYPPGHFCCKYFKDHRFCAKRRRWTCHEPWRQHTCAVEKKKWVMYILIKQRLPGIALTWWWTHPGHFPCKKSTFLSG